MLDLKMVFGCGNNQMPVDFNKNKRTEKRKQQMANVKASFDVTTVEGQMKVFNAQNGASVSLKTLENGMVINAVGVLQYEEMVTSYGANQESTVTTIFSEDGTAYAGVSDTVAKAGEKLIDFIASTGLTQFKVKIIKAKSQRGQEFLNLQLV
jgi:hypothetical protein